MKKTDIYDFIKLAMQDHEFSLQPWQEEFVKSLGQPKHQFIYRSARGFHDELMWQIQLEVFRTFWLDGKSTVMVTPRFCDVRRPHVIIDEIWQLREVFAERDELWYQENYLNPWVEPNDDTPTSGGRDEH